MTLDYLSEGRLLLGIGASGPQVVEGWYGQPYPKPLERTREYVEVMRQVMAREPVSYTHLSPLGPIPPLEPITTPLLLRINDETTQSRACPLPGTSFGPFWFSKNAPV